MKNQNELRYFISENRLDALWGEKSGMNQLGS